MIWSQRWLKPSLIRAMYVRLFALLQLKVIFKEIFLKTDEDFQFLKLCFSLFCPNIMENKNEFSEIYDSLLSE